MIQTMKRSLALFLALMMCLAFLPTLFLATSATEVTYKYDGKYIYNWGNRGTVATFLSPNAKTFYEDNNASYTSLSSLSGGTGKSNAPSSALYKALQNLMVSAHKKQTDYQETRYLYKYTDCQNNGGSISSFYSGKAIGPSWDGSWNREHTWPNSKGLGGADENDIMMLRPTSTNENSSRGNTAYGQSSSYYNPNSESGGKYDLRGDTARIFLYVYVRWGNINKAWGTGGVMESVEVLLEWMEADPVDTWELGRNDSVESITGTRNVFVDYPEFAFLLFGEEIPANMQTPSGEASGSGAMCDHNNFGAGVVTTPTCTEKGYTLFVCQTVGCDCSYKENVTPALGHKYTNGICTACGESEPSVPTYVTKVEVGKAYKLGLYSTEEYFFTGSIINQYYGASETGYDNGVDVYLEQTNGGYYLYFKNSSNQKQYINAVASGTYRNFTISSTATSVFTWDTSKNALKTTVSGETCYIGNYGQYSSMNILTESKLKDSDYIARLYVMNGNSQDNPGDDPTCQHNYKTVVTAPTCTKEGFTTYTCSLCNNTYTDNKVAALGHNYVNSTCTRCGATKAPVTDTEATIRFDDTANRTVFSKSQQVWVQNGITVTNDKTSTSSDIADYINPVRFYQGSNVTISYPGMTKIVIDCSGMEAKHVDSWLNITGATATKSNGIVTIVFDKPTDTVTYVGLAKQTRAYSITVYAEAQEPECNHTNTTVEGKIEATCSTDGHTGKTYCLDCQTVLGEGEVVPATGHVFAAWVVIRTPNCTAEGLERRDCDNCSDYETKQTPALGHTDKDANEICDVCERELTKEEENTPSTPDDDTTTETEEHICKEVNGFQAFINKIINFFRRLFGQPELCPCGEIILEKKD